MCMFKNCPWHNFYKIQHTVSSKLNFKAPLTLLVPWAAACVVKCWVSIQMLTNPARPACLHVCACNWQSNWRILAWIATSSVSEIIYDQFGGGFFPTPGGQNNHKLVIDTPDSPYLWVLKMLFYSWPYTILAFYQSCSMFWGFLAVSDNFSSSIAKYDACAGVFSTIAAKLGISKKN